MMLLLLLLVVGMVSNTLSFVDNKDGHILIQIVFYEIKPYIFWDEEKSRWTGIYPLMFNKGGAYCTNAPDKRIVEYTVKMDSRKGLENIMRSNTSEGQGVLSNLTRGTTGWLPYDINFNKVGAYFLKRNLTVLNLLSSNKMVVIQPRERIELPNKLMRGFQSCDLIIVISVLLSITFGMAVYIIERPYNPIFKDRMGLLTSLYWSFVTMTTVGYGDVVPVTVLGKAVSVVWMFFGIMVASVYTATLTNVVTGINGLEISGKNVAVVKDSHEEYFVKRDYLANPMLYETYTDAINAVREGEVHSAVIPYDIAGWMQDEIRIDNKKHKVALSMVYILEGKVPFNFLVSSNNPVLSELFKCMFDIFQQEVVQVSEELYKRPVIIEQTVYFDNAFEVFTRNLHVQILSGVTLLLVTVAVVLWMAHQREHKVTTKERKRKTIEHSMSELSSLLNEYKELVKKDEMEMT